MRRRELAGQWTRGRVEVVMRGEMVLLLKSHPRLGIHHSLSIVVGL